MLITSQHLKEKLKKELSAIFVDVIDDSDGCGAKFSVTVVSDIFEGKSLLQRHRLVNTALKEELPNIHAFSQKTLTVKQWQEQVSAPGKIILFGEHSVVFGKSAIAAAIDKRTTITFEQLCEFTDTISTTTTTTTTNTSNTVTNSSNGTTEIASEEHSEGECADNTNDNCEKICLELVNFNYKKEILLNTIIDKQKEIVPVHPRQCLSLSTPEFIDHAQLIRTVNNDVNELNDSLEMPQLTALTAIFYLLRGMFAAAKCSLKYPLKITVASDLNLGAGTGSSASLSVSLVASFFHYIVLLSVRNVVARQSLLYKNFSDQDLLIINKWALNLERIFHGQPSGLDNFVATYGSIVETNLGTENKRVMNVINSGGMLKILLIHSGIARSTMHMVRKVSELRERNPHVTQHILSAMDIIAADANRVIKQIVSLHIDNPIDINSLNDEILRLQDLIDINQGLLVSLTVSNKELNDIVDITASFKLHSKITGAGGGGYVYAFIPPWTTPEVVADCVRTLKEKGYDAFEVKLGCPGVTLIRNK